MKIFPAIDLRGGRVVRLTEGDYDRMTVYGDDPVATACGFAEKGAECLHVVDLDGALAGEAVNAEIIERIVLGSGLTVEIGGGIRTEERIARYLECGAKRVIIGTIALEKPDFVLKMTKKYGAAIAVGVDARDGKVAVHGWKTVTDTDAFEFCEYLRDSGTDCVIFTDISRDGTLMGTNLAAYERLAKLEGLNVVASGGITRAEEIRTLAGMGLYGAIVGKAIYTGALPLEAALAAAKEGICSQNV